MTYGENTDFPAAATWQSRQAHELWRASDRRTPVRQVVTDKSGPNRAATSMLTSSLLIDTAERMIVTVLYTWLAARILLAYGSGGESIKLLLLLSEGLVVFFMLIRRPARDLSRNWVEWLMAIFATCTPLLVVPVGGRGLIPPAIAVILLMTGVVVQLHAKITLGRSFGMIPAHRGLKMSGPYRLIRHPMYAGYLMTHVAFLAMNPVAWNLLVYTICYGLQIPRLLAEEEILSRDADYRSYREKVRYRLVPGVF